MCVVISWGTVSSGVAGLTLQGEFCFLTPATSRAGRRVTGPFRAGEAGRTGAVTGRIHRGTTGVAIMAFLARVAAFALIRRIAAQKTCLLDPCNAEGAGWAWLLPGTCALVGATGSEIATPGHSGRRSTTVVHIFRPALDQAAHARAVDDEEMV